MSKYGEARAGECSACKFYAEGSPSDFGSRAGGQCQRYPAWVAVDAEHWCGEFVSHHAMRPRKLNKVHP